MTINDALSIPRHSYGPDFEHTVHEAVRDARNAAQYLDVEQQQPYTITRFVHPGGLVTFHVYGGEPPVPDALGVPVARITSQGTVILV